MAIKRNQKTRDMIRDWYITRKDFPKGSLNLEGLAEITGLSVSRIRAIACEMGLSNRHRRASEEERRSMSIRATEQHEANRGIRPAIFNGDATATIHLPRGLSTVVDSVDADFSRCTWHSNSTGRAMRTATSQEVSEGKSIDVLLHREILERVIGRPLESGEYPDHIDGDPLNNRRENLRLASRAQNNRNRKLSSNSSTGLKGVTKHRNKWAAQIGIDNKRLYLGLFDTPQEAHAAYCEAAVRMFGQFARFG